MAHMHIALIGFLAISGVVAQVPSYTVTYTSYSESISTLLEVSSGHCKLINGLYDVAAKAGFTAAQNVTFYNFLEELETEVINNGSITNETVKLYDIGKEIAYLNVTQPQIFTLINQYNITGWSTVSNFISITNSYNIQASLQLLVSSDVTGNAPFFTLILEALNGAGLTAEYTAFEAFINAELKSIILDKTITESIKWARIYAKFLDVFFVQYPTYYTSFYKLDLGVSGSFYQLFQTGLTYYQDEQVSSFILGDVTTCPFLLQLSASIYNKSLPFPNTVRAQIKQLYNVLVQGFETTTTLEARLEFISAKFGSFIGLQWNYFTWFQYCGFGDFGNFYQFITYIGTKSICGGSFPQSAPPPLTTVASITPAATTVVPTEATTEASTAVTSEATTEVSTGATSEPSTAVTSEASTGATSEVSTAATSEASTAATSEASTAATSVLSTLIPSSSTQCSCVCV